MTREAPRTREAPGTSGRRRGRGSLLAVTAALPLVLAHDGAGATWQAILVVMSLGLVVVVALAVIGRVSVGRPDDLVLPLASIAIASSLAPLGSAWLSDWIGWAFPVGVTMLAALLVAATTSLELHRTDPLVYAATGLAVVGAAVLSQPLTMAWHPPPEFLPLAEGVEITIADPQEGTTVPAGTVPLTVTVTGGSIAGELVEVEAVGPDPEEGGVLVVSVDGASVPVEPEEDCTRRAACLEVTVPVELDPGERRVSIEFRRADGASFTPLVTDRVDLLVE